MAEAAGSIHAEIMRRIHGTNIYSGFAPTFAEDLQGWNSEHTSFEEIISGLRPSVVIDVGVWKGASTIYLANVMKRHGLAGAVIGVDTFLGSVEHWDPKSAFSGLIPFRFGMPMLYEQFLSNVVRCGAQDRIVPLAQTSMVAGELMRRLGIRAGLIHIDASHDYEDVLQDARTYWEILTPGGFLVGDDYNQDWPDVMRAANQFAEEKSAKVLTSKPKWIIRKAP
ncbi:MAG TPA: class I SAM-dependent methyltransferase [Acetobacteraceae bacterium]|nr:class I SAM-dependent methyltransferase [Acetobacteraceae bacterium]